MADKGTAEKRRYRKVLCRMYGDEKFRQLSGPKPNGQTLWTYLITGPHTTSVPGLFVAGEAQLAEALGWSLAGFRSAWREIAALSMGQADWKARVVWLPNAIRHNKPENPNVVRGWRDALDEIPACELKTHAITSLRAVLATCKEGEAFLKAFAEVLGEAFVKDSPKAFREGSADPSANQEQEQEQEQEEERDAPPPSPKPSPKGGLSVGRLFLHRWQLDALIDALGPHAAGFELDVWLEGLTAKADAQGLTFPTRDARWAWVQAELAAECLRRGLPVAGAAAPRESRGRVVPAVDATAALLAELKAGVQ